MGLTWLSDHHPSMKDYLPTQNFTEISCRVMVKKTIFITAVVRHLEFKKIIFGHVTVEFKCPVVYHISSKSDGFSLMYSYLTICNMAGVRHLEFSKLQFLSPDLYRHAILLPCAKCNWNLTIGCWGVTIKKRFSKWRPSAIVNFNFFIFGYLYINCVRYCICLSLYSEICDSVR